jgi:hypothetical protein
MSRGDRIALASDPTWLGTLDGDPDDTGTVRVSGDGGWTGRLHVDALRPAAEDKSWPPAGLEVK